MTLRVQVQSAQGRSADYEFDQAEIVIGRGANAAVVIADARVSRQHARIVRRDGQWWVEDLGTRNGTLLNGAAMTAAAHLAPGDRLEIGGAVLRIMGQAAEATGAAAPDAASTAASRSSETAGIGRDALRMRAINQIHQALAGSLTLTELLDLILARCFDVLGPEEGAIMLRGADGSVYHAAQRRAGPGDGVVPVPRRLVDEVLGKGKPALVVDAAYDDRFAGSNSVLTTGIRSILAAPLIDAEGSLGLITLSSRLAVRTFAAADLDMLVSIAAAAALRVRNVALAEALAARRVVEHELALAHDVQMSMLPRPLPPRADVQLAAQLTPAREIGGDLSDFVVDGDRLWFIVADVAGKSIAAALYMAIVKTLFRATACAGADIEEVAGRMNRELARDNDRMMFVTAAMGSLDLVSGALALVDAGHNPALIFPGRLDVPKGMALGVVADAAYAAVRLTINRGTTLVLYTDGLTDARNTAGEMFGEPRLHAAIAAAAAEAPEALVAQVIGAVEGFAAGAPPDDDLTLLALRYRG
jgi:serine phosphatase RsbU (regulator of sigma subunit)